MSGKSRSSEVLGRCRPTSGSSCRQAHGFSVEAAFLREAAAKAATRTFDSSASRLTPIVFASSARFSSNVRWAPTRMSRLACPNAAVAFSSQNRATCSARLARSESGTTSATRPQSSASCAPREQQQQLQRAALADRGRQQRGDAEVGREADVRVLAHELRRVRRDDVVRAQHEPQPAAGDSAMHGRDDRLVAEHPRPDAVVDDLSGHRDAAPAGGRHRHDVAAAERLAGLTVLPRDVVNAG